MLTIQIPDMSFVRLLLLPLIILLFLNACQPVQAPLIKNQPIQIRTVAAESAGQYQQAAQEYLQLATDSQGEAQALYYLRAAELFWQTGAVNQASQALQQVDERRLSKDKLFNVAILKADIALFDGLAEAALIALADVDERSLSKQESIKLFKQRSIAYELTSNWPASANAHLRLDSLLSDEAAIQKNRETLWQSLMQMTPQDLDLYNPGYPPSDDSGWFALAYIIKAYQDNPEAIEMALDDWRRSYPSHPADPDLYMNTLRMLGTQLPQQIQDIAVMLPDEGPFVMAASAIKQGIIAAHYTSGAGTRLHFMYVKIDPYSGHNNVDKLYQEAISLGAELVIGPLNKTSVETLAKRADLPVPILALNQVELGVNKPNLYQFSLSPEDEAIAVANFARSKGYQRAVILFPQGDWGSRVANAFSQAWREQGGNILSIASYKESDNDFRNTLMPLMGLDISQQRYRTLKSILGRSLEFEPRRRQDIDFLFMVANPLKARQLVTQLKFHRSGNLPLIATSHSYSGQSDPQQDIDLDKLIITDIPWMFVAKTTEDKAYQILQSQIESNPVELTRLYAMGVDAYRLIPKLNQLSRDPEQVYQGATGMLSIDETGKVNRQMDWGQFEKGRLQQLQ